LGSDYIGFAAYDNYYNIYKGLYNITLYYFKILNNVIYYLTIFIFFYLSYSIIIVILEIYINNLFLTYNVI